MKKITLSITLILTANLLFAKTWNETAITAGKNKFDRPELMKSYSNFYGIRTTVYDDKYYEHGYGFQLGYERGNNANCKGVDLDRIYANLVLNTPNIGKLTPYFLVGGGYEMSSAEIFTPNQGYFSAGLGLKYLFDNGAFGFLEQRALSKFDTEETNLITTIGLGYNFTVTPDMLGIQGATTSSMPVIIQSEEPASKTVSTYETIYIDEPTIETKTYTSKHNHHKSSYNKKGGKYYVQLALYTVTDPKPLLDLLDRKGFEAVTKRSSRGTLILAGPYKNRADAQRHLRRLKHIKRDAYIVKR